MLNAFIQVINRLSHNWHLLWIWMTDEHEAFELIWSVSNAFDAFL